MTILNNIYRCSLCRLHAIAEEKDSHVCLELKETRFDGDTKLVFDGKIWYPLKQPNINNQRKHHSDRQNHFVIVFIFLTRFSNATLTSFVLLLIPIRYA